MKRQKSKKAPRPGKLNHIKKESRPFKVPGKAGQEAIEAADELQSMIIASFGRGEC